MKSFYKRLLTGIFILAVLVAGFWLKTVSPIFMDALILFISVMAIIEVGRAITPKFSRPLYFIALGHLFASYALILIGTHTEWLQPASRYSTLLYISIELPVVFIILLLSAFFIKPGPATEQIKNPQFDGNSSNSDKSAETAGKKTLHTGLPTVFSTSFLLFYPAVLLIFLLSLNNIVSGGGADLSMFGLIMLFAVSLFSDTGAYFVGIIFKGPKLCPNISPKKTISGAVGGLLGGAAGALAACALFSLDFLLPNILGGQTFGLHHYFIMGVLGSAFTQAGDLAASYIKRYCGIKDYSNVFPGHGGFMDRLDGLIFNSIFVYFYLMIILV